MRRVVLVICDGTRMDFLSPERTPVIHRLRQQGSFFARHRAVFPSVTRVSSACIATGCHPARHGLHGNTMGLWEAGEIAIRDVGLPDFRERLRRATGATLRVPTLAERLRDHGGAVVYSNVSPGAAYFQDPDHHGAVYHRAGSFLPGGSPAADGLDIEVGVTGDRAMSARFCREVLGERRPALAVLWLSEPDHTMHHAPLGSDEHWQALAMSDRCVGDVIATVADLERAGEEILLLVGSDHGQETVRRMITVEPMLVAAGLKDGPASTDLQLAPQGTGGLIYADPRGRERLPALVAFLDAQDWVNGVWAGEDLADLGLAPEGGLLLAFGTAGNNTPNEYGVPGCRDRVTRHGEKDETGRGQHGGLGPYEQHPFLLAVGAGFPAAHQVDAPSSLVDIAPTVLAFLGLPGNAMDGRPLQGRL